ncbi:MAG: exopolyphosphatase [Gemmatimonadales bacterium]|nr:exopolyphosphatase [Gemmatimonadales bacterium]
MADQRYRLVTRSDFDGVASAVLLKSRDLIDDILFVHPKDVQDGKVEITERDITTNLPYAPRCHLAFDHHASETVRIGGKAPANLVLDPDAPSATRVVYRHFGGRDAFPSVSETLLAAVDKADSAQFTREEILDPQGWVLLGFLMDSRTGLGRFRDFGVSNYQLMMALVDYCRRQEVDEILRQPHVAERVALYREHREPFLAQLKRCATVHGNLVEVDLRGEETIYAGNRFVIYALNPACSISMHVMGGRAKQNTVFAIGKSVLNRTSKTHIGDLALRYGGGGHDAAGTCQVDNDRAGTVRAELIRQITTDG